MRPRNPPLIWVEGYEVFLEIPSTLVARSHTVRLPDEPKSWQIIMRVLRERGLLPQGAPESRIGFDSAPTQAQCEIWLRDNRPQALLPSLAELAEADELLREVGLL